MQYTDELGDIERLYSVILTSRIKPVVHLVDNRLSSRQIASDRSSIFHAKDVKHTREKRLLYSRHDGVSVRLSAVLTRLSLE